MPLHGSIAGTAASVPLARNTNPGTEVAAAAGGPEPGDPASDGAEDSPPAPPPDPPPDVPEPLLFDLVRGLGARAGELEVNVLATVPLRRGTVVEWAPEIEWAPFDGIAFEAELPMLNDRVEAVKLAFQGTFGQFPGGRAIHGVQLLGEHSLHQGGTELNLLYLLAAELGNHFSTMIMVGPRIDHIGGEQDRPAGMGGVVNGSIFFKLPGDHALGLETNWLRTWQEGTDIVLLPQVHVRLGKHGKIQLGAGYHQSADARELFGATRLILER